MIKTFRKWRFLKKIEIFTGGDFLKNRTFENMKTSFNENFFFFIYLLETTQRYIDRKRSTRRRTRNPPAKDNKNTGKYTENKRTPYKDQSLWSTHHYPIKLNHIKRSPLKCLGTESPKKSKENNRVPKELWIPCFILENPRVSFPPHNLN